MIRINHHNIDEWREVEKVFLVENGHIKEAVPASYDVMGYTCDNEADITGVFFDRNRVPLYHAIISGSSITALKLTQVEIDSHPLTVFANERVANNNAENAKLNRLKSICNEIYTHPLFSETTQDTGITKELQIMREAIMALTQAFEDLSAPMTGNAPIDNFKAYNQKAVTAISNNPVI